MAARSESSSLSPHPLPRVEARLETGDAGRVSLELGGQYWSELGLCLLRRIHAAASPHKRQLKPVMPSNGHGELPGTTPLGPQGRGHRSVRKSGTCSIAELYGISKLIASNVQNKGLVPQPNETCARQFEVSVCVQRCEELLARPYVSLTPMPHLSEVGAVLARRLREEATKGLEESNIVPQTTGKIRLSMRWPFRHAHPCSAVLSFHMRGRPVRRARSTRAQNTTTS